MMHRRGGMWPITGPRAFTASADGDRSVAPAGGLAAAVVVGGPTAPAPSQARVAPSSAAPPMKEWAPHKWYDIELSCMQGRAEWTDAEAAALVAYLQAQTVLMPCPSCREHLLTFMTANPVTLDAARQPSVMRAWLAALHADIRRVKEAAAATTTTSTTTTTTLLRAAPLGQECTSCSLGAAKTPASRIPGDQAWWLSGRSFANARLGRAPFSLSNLRPR
jgi:hypothetical protein